MKILNSEIPIGKETVINLTVAGLPTRTEVNIPVFVYKSPNPGPSILLTAGMHGDEINGIEIIRRILDNNLNHIKRGTCICIPIINVFGFLHFSRYVPDGKDVNRSFPGKSKGSLASRIAWSITNHILPFVDMGIDFHTGSDQLANYPQIRGDFQDQSILELAKQTQAPFLINAPLIARSFRKEAYKRNKKILVYEGGESTRFSKLAIEEGMRCAVNFLQANQMTTEKTPLTNKSTLLSSKKWYRSPASGIWVAEVKEGDFVKKGDKLGYITSPYGDFRKTLNTQQDGYVIGLNHQAVVNNGDALLNLGRV